MDALAVVLDCDLDKITQECGADFNLRLGRAVLDGVEEEVAED